MRSLALSALFALLAGACGPGDLATPGRISTFGHEVVRLESGRFSLSPEDRPKVRVGGASAFDVRVIGPSGIEFVPQGSPSAGPVDVAVEIGAKELVFRDAIEVLEPAHPALERLVAMGASITMGAQNMTIDQDSQLNSPAAHLARAAGAYLPMPLIRRDAWPGVELDSFDSACRQTRRFELDYGTWLDSFYDPQKDGHYLYRVRVDPEMVPRNVAIGGATVSHLIDGYDQANGFIAAVAQDPSLSVIEAVSAKPRAQIDLVEELAPSAVIMFDLIANDFSFPIHNGMDPALLTPIDEMRDLLRRLFARLAETRAEVFVADMPPLALVPDIALQVEILVEKGESREEVMARLEALSAEVRPMNAALYEAASAYPTIHVLPFHDEIERLLQEGRVEVAGQRLSFGWLGGIVSLDGLHLTNTANAYLANMMIRQMNDVLGASIPEADLAAVAAQDPLVPANLAPMGFDCATR